MVFYAYIKYVERYSLQWKTKGSNVLIYNKKPIRVKRFLYYFYISVNPLSQLLRRAQYTKSRGVSFGRLTGTRGPGVTQSPYRSTQVLYTIILYITYIVFNYTPTYTTIRLISPHCPTARSLSAQGRGEYYSLEQYITHYWHPLFHQ